MSSTQITERTMQNDFCVAEDKTKDIFFVKYGHSATRLFFGWSSHPELLVEHCLIFYPYGTEVCQLVLARVIQVTLQLL